MPTLCILRRASNETLEKENRMFEKFLKRLDPKDFKGTHTQQYILMGHPFLYELLFYPPRK